MRLKQKLLNQHLSIGSWITFNHQSIVEIMATAGFDWLTIDMEHSVIDIMDAQNLIGHIQGKGLKALVRVGKNEEVIIKRVMDAGADGVIIPMVNSKEAAEKAVSYVRYPPDGQRGVGLARAQKYGIGFKDYNKWLKSEVVIIAQIEHIEAVNNIRDILETNGIDGIIIGPYDLSGSLGYPGEFDRKEVKDAISRVKNACEKYKKALGFHVIQPDYHLLQDKIKEGFNFIAFSLDFLFLGNKAREEMSKYRDNR